MKKVEKLITAFALSYNQQALWFQRQFAPRSAVYNVSFAASLPAELHLPALKQAFRTLVGRHACLRTTFSAEGSKPIQRVNDKSDFELTALDASGWNPEEVKEWLEEEAHRPFDLREGPLLRASLLSRSVQEHILLLTTHLIVCDVWSLRVLITDLCALYSAGKEGRQPLEAPPSAQYRDQVTRQVETLAGPEGERLWAYWRNELCGELPLLDLPTDRPRPSNRTYHSASQGLELSAELTEQLKEVAGMAGASIYELLLAAYVVLLHRYSGQVDILLGLPVTNRTQEEFARTVGYFSDPVVIRADLSTPPSFKTLLEGIRAKVSAALEHKDYPFSLLVERLRPRRDPGRPPIFQVMYFFEQSRSSERQPLLPFLIGREGARLTLEGLVLESINLERRATEYDLILFVCEVGGRIFTSLQYDAELFESASAGRMLSHYQVLLESIISYPEREIRLLPLLTETEKRQLLDEWNSNRAGSLPDECIHELFRKQAEATPEAKAICCEEEELTFGELERRSNQMANYLQAGGVSQDVPVGVCLERSIEMVVSLLGILKAGGAYVPLDVTYPKDRLAFMLKNAGLSLLVTKQSLVNRLPDHQAGLVCIDKQWDEIARSSEVAPLNMAVPSNLAYVIYTSGSTGTPKGVLGLHNGAVNRFKWMWDTYSFEAGEVCCQKTSLSFLDSLWELFGPLLRGIPIVIIPDRKVKDPRQLVEAFSVYGITRIVLVPSLLQAILDTETDIASKLFRLRYCVSSGESLAAALAARFLEALPHVILLNLYGSSEVSADATWFDVSKGSRSTTVPIGRPIGNMRVYILDGLMQPAPIGAPGSLYVGGVGLARGYLENADLTAEQFIPDAYGTEPGQRLYKTGDLACYKSNGTIEYLGRADYQVKIRGFRVELGEIEQALRRHPAIQSAIVVAHQDRPGDNRLAAYLVPNSWDRLPEERIREWQNERIREWRNVWDETYDQTSPHHDPTLNYVGWNSSYTGQPVPLEEVSEWLDLISERILSLAPEEVLEIGCGSGMILFHIAPHCRRYLATDFSAAILDRLQQQISRPGIRLPQVTLSRRLADDFEGIEPESFSMVILTGVTQYMPSIEYLVRVLEGAVRVVKPGGVIFIGDVRSLSLLEAFHTSVQLHQASSSLPTIQLKQRIRKHMLHEQELVIAPGFFSALQAHLPEISRVETPLRRGRRHNEFTKFRYDAILRINDNRCAPAAYKSLDWQDSALSIEELRGFIRNSAPKLLAVTNVPNARVMTELKAIQLLAEEDGPEFADELRKSLLDAVRPGIDPEEFWTLGKALSYRAEIRWSKAPHCYDVLFARRDEDGLNGSTPASILRPSQSQTPWKTYANDPLQGRLIRKLVPELRAYLQEKLPDYMIPGSFVLLDSLPLTPSGKLNRQALPDPQTDRPELEENYVAPRAGLEAALARIWAEVLGLQRVGLYDNFFELGGHSLIAVMVSSRARSTLDVDVPLQMFFEAPTVAGQAKSIEDMRRSQQRISARPVFRADRNQVVPVSFGQERLLFLNQLVPDSPFYNVPIAARLVGLLSLGALENSLNKIIARHEALRTAFRHVGGHDAQIVAPSQLLSLTVIDLRELGRAPREAAAERLLNQEGRRPFDLKQGPMMRSLLVEMEEREHLLLITMHHTVTDGWSMGVLVNELRALYGAALRGEEAELPELEIQYADFAVWQREWLQGEVLERQLEYWKRQLRDLPPIDLPTDHLRPAVQSHNGVRQIFQIPAGLAESLRALSHREGVTLFILLLAAFKVLLYRYTGQKDIAVGTPVANRNQEVFNEVIGFFVNLLVLRNQLDGARSFRNLVRQVRGVVLEAYANQDAPFEKVVEEIKPEQDRSRTPLFQVVYTMQSGPKPTLQLPGLISTPVEINTGATQFDLVLSINEEQRVIAGWISYNTDLFDCDTIARLLGQWQILIEGIVADPDSSVTDLPLMSEAERQHLLSEWSGVRVTYPADKTIPDLYQAQVESRAEAIALTYGRDYLDYGQLNRRANRLARYLRGLGVASEVRVGLLVDRSLEMVIGLLGTLKAGGIYVPIDPNYPKERIKFMIEDSKAQVILSQRRHVERAPEGQASLVLLDSDWEKIARQSDEDLDSGITAESLACVIYTSGSSGEPKGVGTPHRAIVRLLFGIDYVTIDHTKSALQMSPLTFDASTFEIWGPLLNGGRCCLAAEQVLTPEALGEAIEVYGITTMWLTASLYNFAIDENPKALERIEQLLIGGEALSVSHVKRGLEQLPKVEIINGYGPTEGTTFSCCHKVVRRASFYKTTIPIGRPISNTQVYVLDKNLQPVPVGLPGELYIGGDGLARGYLDQALTAEKFIPNPFSKEEGARLYKTGDRARYLRDGCIDFLGRLDNQVKVRGYRIEPGEIEAILEQHAVVDRAVVVAREDDHGGKRLVAYIAYKKGDRLGAAKLRERFKGGLPDYAAHVLYERRTKHDVASLKEYLKERLPEYMTPSVLVTLDAIPLKPNGKVDHQALPSPYINSDLEEIPHVAPRTPTEKKLAEMWAEVLNVKRVGIDDHFFDLGGHSLKATQLVSRIRSHFAVELPLQEIFASPNIRGIAAAVDGRLLAKSTSSDLDGILAMLEGIDEDEARKRLTLDES